MALAIPLNAAGASSSHIPRHLPPARPLSAHLGRVVLLRRHACAFSTKRCLGLHSSPVPLLAHRRAALLPVRAQGEAEVATSEITAGHGDDAPAAGAAEVGNSQAASEDAELAEIQKRFDANPPSLPPEFLRLMEYKGTPPNYWIVGACLAAVFVTRKAIWAELKLWAELAVFCLRVAFDLCRLGLSKLVKLGGEPLISVLIFICWVGLTIHNVCRFVSEVTPIGPAIFSVVLASIVLIVGERVSDTYGSCQFPSRNVLDGALLLGFATFVGIVPEVVMVLGLIGLTGFLLAVKKMNPVAGCTPAAAVLAAVSAPFIRYPVLVSFVGTGLYRYWRLGYLSSGAVQKERMNAEYPRVLVGLLYLVGLAFVLRTVFNVVDFVTIGISLVRASG